jgi:hypothetical protein
LLDFLFQKHLGFTDTRVANYGPVREGLEIMVLMRNQALFSWLVSFSFVMFNKCGGAWKTKKEIRGVVVVLGKQEERFVA